MIPPIKLEINTEDIYNQFDVSNHQVEEILDFIVKEITSSFYQKWRNEAKLNLHETRDRYLQNLKILDEGRLTGVVLLDYSKDPLIRMIEEGASAFDIKEYFEKSSKKTTTKNNGWYLTIPFQHKVSNANDTSLELPKLIYELAKNLKSDGKDSLKFEQLPNDFQTKQTRAGFSSIPTSKTYEEYKHKASKYEGLVKNKDAVTNQNTYNTFRRVSNNSDTNSWIHPGLDIYDLASKAMSSLENTMELEISSALNAALQSMGII